MKQRVGWLWIAGFLAVAATASMQTSTPAAAAGPFDGTYHVVSSTRVYQTYTSKTGQMGQCPDRAPGPLTIHNSKVRYTTETGHRLKGTVGPQGDLTMGMQAPGGGTPISLNLSGGVDGSGTVHARQTSNSCSYDFVWQKQTR